MGCVGFVFLVLALVACGAPAATPVPTVTPTVPPTPTPGCAPDAVVAFLAELDTILTEWDDANELAHSTARMSLPAQIESLPRLPPRTRKVLISQVHASQAQAGIYQAAG